MSTQLSRGFDCRPFILSKRRFLDVVKDITLVIEINGLPYSEKKIKEKHSFCNVNKDKFYKKAIVKNGFAR